MEQNGILRDPLGHPVHLPIHVLPVDSPCCFNDVQRVILSPAFMIQQKEALYFVRLVAWEFTLLVEAVASQEGFVVRSCIVNPTTDFISVLLENGRLIPLL